MLTALFIILMFAVFGKLILLAFKASWGILKVLLTIIIFPLFMGIDGVMYAGPIADAAAFVLAIVFARRELGKMRSAEIA